MCHGSLAVTAPPVGGVLVAASPSSRALANTSQVVNSQTKSQPEAQLT